MRDQLIAYLLDDLSPEERQRVEERLENDPVWQEEFERLRQCTRGCASDPKSTCPPSDLANRTCQYVRQNADTNHKLVALSESHDGLVGKKRWSFVDLVVAATVLIAVSSLLFPALRDSRDSARQVDCENNLYHLGIALAEYSDRFGQGLPRVEPGENAGIFVVKLADSGVVDRQRLAELLVCPSSSDADEVFAGRTLMLIPTQAQLDAMPADVLARLKKQMAGSYAYRFGYRDQAGNYRQVRFVRLSTAPMLADTPSFSVAGFQSANHGGCGQNVLYQDLSVRYIKHCLSQENVDHLYLNEDRKHAAGRHARDVVLGRSEVGPAGPLVRATSR
ncbi:MAG: DUF1559 domain-containing protein [Planctomycetes bacterium]|nr:DUF1559 domain-containing protein [Planctomycetota bacterium]